jgi:cardiolipin synthase
VLHRSTRRLRAIVTTVVLTGALVLVALNLTLGDKHVDSVFESLYAVEHPQFVRTMGAMLGPALEPGNEVRTLVNGAEIFPAMLSAIANAKRSITLETYVYWSGTIGKTFAQALAERARAGIEVRVLLDAFGIGNIEDIYMDYLRANGVQVREYNAPVAA